PKYSSHQKTTWDECKEAESGGIMRWLSEYVLKGIFLGLLVFVALQETGWSQTGQVVLFTLLGLVVSLAIASWQKLRQGYQLRGRFPAFMLFSLLESPGTVYAGVILGLAIGAFSIRKLESERLFLITFVAGGLLGVVFCLLQLVTNRWARAGSSLA